MMQINSMAALVLLVWMSCSFIEATYEVGVVSRSVLPVLSSVDGNSDFSIVFNPSWIEPSAGTNNVGGLIVRTQNCSMNVEDACAFCGGSEDKASILTFSTWSEGDKFSYIDSKSTVFGPYDDTDSWGTEDPRVKYNPNDGLYYMFYTAYNGSDIFLSLATSPNPTSSNKWTRHGAVFPSAPGSKSGALLIRSEGPHYLLWGDSSIRIAESNDLTKWSNEGEIFLETREDHFDSKLVESGPPPLELSNGDYIFFYNSAVTGWPTEPDTAYHPGWVIMDGKNPKMIKARSEEPLMGPKYAWEMGTSPYPCNAPNVVFLEAAHSLGSVTEGQRTKDLFKVYFGGADETIGAAIISVSY